MTWLVFPKTDLNWKENQKIEQMLPKEYHSNVRKTEGGSNLITQSVCVEIINVKCGYSSAVAWWFQYRCRLPSV